LETAATDFSGPIFTTSSTTEATVRLPVPVAGTVANLAVSLSGEAGGGGKQYVFTVMSNGVATGVTCTVSATGSSCTDATHSAAFTAGQTIALRSAPTANPTARSVRWSVTLTQ
jgi:hypothetical protein